MTVRLQPGDRVAHAGSLGTVAYERGGFVRVRWDGGGVSTVWGADVTRVTA